MKASKKIFFILMVCIVLTAMGLLIYPSFSNYINNKFAVSKISKYNEKIESTDNLEIENLIKKAKIYNKNLLLGKDEDSMEKDFSMIQDNAMIGYIEIPKIKIYSPIYYGTSDKTLKEGVGILKNTSIPIGGIGTHSVLAAHTGLPTQKLFTDIDQLKEGDVFLLHVVNEILTYKVNQIKIVKPSNTEDIKIDENKDYVTLLTCYPYGINTERLLVRGERVNYNPINDVKNNNNSLNYIYNSKISYFMWVIIILLLIIIIVILFLIIKKNKE